jgi:hypothetical protein
MAENKGNGNNKEEKQEKSNPIQEIMKFTRKIDTLPKFVDFIADELIPQLFRNQVKEIYQNSATIIDGIIRNI